MDLQTVKTFARVGLTRTLQTLYTCPTTGGVLSDLITDIQLSNNTRIGTPLAPTISNVGATGSTSHTYYIVANDAWGGKTLVSPGGTTTTSNATLSGTNYNVVTWTPVPGAVSYDILRDSLTTSVATGITGTVNGSNLTYNDTSNSTSAYTAPTINNTGVRAFVYLYHVPNGGTPSASNQIAAGFEVDPGVPADIQVNLVLMPGDTIQGRVVSNQNTDTAIDGNVSIGFSGVENS